MRPISLLASAALVGAVVLSAGSSGEPFASKLVRLEAAAAVPEMAGLLEGEPLAVSAVVLQYAATPVLRLNAQLALQRYPAMSRQVLPAFGGDAGFQEVLAEYGPAVIPPIAYFLDHDIPSLAVRRTAGQVIDGARHAAWRVLERLGARSYDGAAMHAVSVSGELTALERGAYAIDFIREDGHDFLGQFAVDAAGQVAWIQTERITEATAQFFSGGIRGLEIRLRGDSEPSASDYLWAGVDLTLAAGAVKVLRLGRTTGTGARTGGAAVSTSLGTQTLLRAGRTALRVGRYGGPVAVAFAVVRHPSLISGLGAQIATLLHLPVHLVQAVVWFVVLLPLLILASLIARWLIGPAVFTLMTLTRWLARHERRGRRRRQAARTAAATRAEPRIGDLSHHRSHAGTLPG